MNPSTELDGENRIVRALNHINRRVAKVHQKMHIAGRDASSDRDQPGEPIRIKHADHVSANSTIGQPGKKNPIRIYIVLFANLVNETEYHFLGRPCPPGSHRVGRA